LQAINRLCKCSFIEIANLIFREKVIEANEAKALPVFAVTSHIKTGDVFCGKPTESLTEKDFFVATSEDGWLFIYDAIEHK